MIKAFFARFADSIRIIALVAAAVIGLLFSSRFITSKSKPPFHEIRWNPKEVLQTLLNNAEKNVNAVVDSLAKAQNLIWNKKRQLWIKGDTSASISKEMKEQLNNERTKVGVGYYVDSLEQTQLQTLNKIQQWLNSNSDSAIRAEISTNSTLFIHTDDFSMADYSIDTSVKPNVLQPAFLVTYRDSELIGKQISGSVILSVTQYTDTEKFYNKYPGFGLWSLLLIVQTTFYCMLIVGFLFHFLSASANSLYKKFLDYKPATLLMLLAGMAGFVFTVFFKLIRHEQGLGIKGKFFMVDLDDFFLLVNLLGHVSAAFCLVGMISSVMYMNQLKTKINNPDPLKPISPAEIEQVRTEIKRRFRTYFVFIAIILTLAIFTSGIFYSGMNGLEFVKQVTKDQGYSPVDSSMVYIYGILNSFFLVIIYLPLKILLGSLDKSIPAPAKADNGGAAGQQEPGDDSKEKKTALGDLLSHFSGLKDVLITASPFLASLLQKLMDVIFS